MRRVSICIILLTIICTQNTRAQYIYYKNPAPEIIQQFNDSANRINMLNSDSADILKHQIGYILKFYPNLQVGKIVVKYNESNSISKTSLTFNSIFKAPLQRIYKISFSTSTKSTLDSVMLKNLTFNSQLALVAHQVSMIEDLSTGGFFNFISYYFKQLTFNGRKRLYLDAELKTLELGLGYQLLTYNNEFREKLMIDNWQNTKGYAYYLKHYKNLPMKEVLIKNFINDLPIYMAHSYK